MKLENIIKVLFRLVRRVMSQFRVPFRAMSNRNMIKISRSVYLAVVSSS
jgi:hypothetical protein